MQAVEKAVGADLSRALLRPASIALIGVSDDPSKTTGRPLAFLRAAGFGGRIYNVNPGRETVQGEPAYASVDALPETPEHVYILTNTDASIEAVEACGRLGVRVATILAAGFSESGPEGVARERRLREIADRYDIRLVGPSSLGVVCLRTGLMLTANASFAEPGLPQGGTFFASHSGSLIGAITSRGGARNIGFHSLVSVGGEVDLSVGEICESVLDDREITSYAIFLESLRHAYALRRFAVKAAERGKPVAAFKLGRSKAAAELAVSHTGALAGEDDVADAFLKDCGIARVDAFETLFEIGYLLERTPPRTDSRPPTVGVVTTTGGGAAMVVDRLGMQGVTVCQPSEDTYRRLETAGVDVLPGRIVDLTMAGTRHDVMTATLRILQSAPEFDLVLVVVGSSARTRPDLAVAPVIDCAHDGKPLACFLVPQADDALRQLAAARVPSFRTPETCADAIAAALSRRAPRVDMVQPAVSGAATTARTLDEAQAYALFERVGVAHAPIQSVPVDATRIALDFDYPVVAKIQHPEIAHKTDVGGVVLDIADEAELVAAVATIRANVGEFFNPESVDQVLVQPMRKGLGEVLIGFRRDPDVGPIVMLAAGGVLAEIYGDRALRLAPVDKSTAEEMVAEVKSLRALAGYRGQREGDLAAVADAVVAVSQLATLSDITVLEAEINPVQVFAAGEGAVAVDAWARIA